MIIRIVTSLLLVSSITACSTVSEYFAGTDNSDPPSPLVDITQSVKIRTLWEASIGSGSEKFRLKLVPTVDNGRIYAADHGGLVRAYDASNGQLIWERETKAPITGGPGSGESLVLVGTSDAEVIALDADNGSIKWRSHVSSEVLSVPRAARGVVVVRTIDGKLFGLNAEDGKRLWLYDRTVPVLTLRGTSSPVIFQDAVINGFSNGKLVTTALKDGNLIWESTIAHPRGRSELERMVDIDADPIISGGVIYVVTFQGFIAVVELQSGRVLWTREMSSNTGIAIDDKYMYVSDAKSHIWAFDRTNGRGLWKQDKLYARKTSAPASVGNYVVVGDLDGYLHWMSRDDGSFVARVRADSSAIVAQPVVVGNTIYVLSQSGKLAAMQAGG